MRFSKVIFILLITWWAWHWYHLRPVTNIASGVVAKSAPVQSSPELSAVSMQGYQLTSLAHFAIKARVLSREDYSLGKEADLSPTDLALGWGRMSDVMVYSQLTITQGRRAYYWRYEQEPPIPTDEIIRSSANMHLIPANDSVRAILRTVRQGQVVSLEGELVEATDATGWRWRSSLTREDSGDGACEVVLVESIRVVENAT